MREQDISILSLLLGMKTTTREMPKQLGVEGREQWQEAGIFSPVFGENISWKRGTDVAASILCKALLTAKPEDRTFQR